ncbi:MAG: hypothetical protein ACQEWL_19685 [Pseudomonadota bacterium]
MSQNTNAVPKIGFVSLGCQNDENATVYQRKYWKQSLRKKQFINIVVIFNLL